MKKTLLLLTALASLTIANVASSRDWSPWELNQRKERGLPGIGNSINRSVMNDLKNVVGPYF